MTVPIFYIKEGYIGFADKQILSDLNIYILPGDKICLVGSNGSGKSSLMKIIYGEYSLDTGELFQQTGLKIAYLRQDIKLTTDAKIYDFVLSEFTEIQNHQHQADILFTQLHIDPTKTLNQCSGGQIRRVLLAKALIDKPDILLLDEPTNHLDINAIEWLEGYLRHYSGAVVCISHDRTFQKNISNKVWWIDRGEMRKSSKGFKYYDEWRREVIQAEEAALRKMNRKLESEHDWLGAGVTARRKRNQKRLSNLYQLRETYRARQAHLQQAKAKLVIELTGEIQQTKFIIEATNISYSMGDKHLINNFSLQVKKGEKIGVIGPNGIGKSTLIRILTKELMPSSGSIKHGTGIDISYFDQHRTMLNPNHSLKQTMCPSGNDQLLIGGRHLHVAAYLKKFMFNPKNINDKVSTLSGGEANRLLLAKALINPANFLILDEPTNDLDLDSLEMLLEILADYSGTLLVVSHDRDFLEQLVTRTLVFTPQGIVDLYGGYEDYLNFYANQTQNTAHHSKSNAHQQNTTLHKQKISAENHLSSTTGAINTVGSKPKLSYKYARLLETLPMEIQQIEQEIKSLELTLSEPNLYLTNPSTFHKMSERLQSLHLLLDDKMCLWLEVEDMKSTMSV